MTLLNDRSELMPDGRTCGEFYDAVCEFSRDNPCPVGDQEGWMIDLYDFLTERGFHVGAPKRSNRSITS